MISATGKATDFKFGRYIHRAHPNKSPLKFWRKGSVDLPIVFNYPLLSQEQVKLRTSNVAGTFIGCIRKKSIKNFGEKGAWAYPGTVQCF